MEKNKKYGSTAPEKKKSLLDIESLKEAYLSHKAAVAACVFVFLCLGVLAKYMISERKEVVGMVLISDENSRSTQLAGMISEFGMGSGFGVNRSIEDEIVIIQSHTVMVQTVKDMGMNVKWRVKPNFLKSESANLEPPLQLTCDPSIPDTLSVGLKFNIDIDKEGKADVTVRNTKGVVGEVSNAAMPALITTIYGDFLLSKTDFYVNGKPLTARAFFTSYDNAAISLAKILDIDLSAEKTDLISIAYGTPEPIWGKMVINSLIKNYNEVTAEQKRTYSRHMLSFIENRLSTLSRELFQSEEDVEAFLKRTDLANPDAQASIILSRATGQEVSLIKSETDYELLLMAIDFLNSEANNTSMLPMIPSISALEGLIEGYNGLILQRLTLEASAKGDNFALTALNKQITAVRNNLLAALKKQAETANFEINELREQYALSKHRLDEVPQLQREYVNIKRQLSVKEQLFMYLLTQREQTEMNIASAQPRGIIIDEAYITDNILGLSGKVILVAMFLLGLALPGVWWTLKWMLSPRVTNHAQATEATELPTIASLTRLDTATKQPVVACESTTAQAQEYRLLRDNLLSKSSLKNGVIAIVGTAQQGQSTQPSVALNLAASLAMAGYKTILVNADLFNDNPLKEVSINGDMLTQAIKGSAVTPLTVTLGESGHKLDVIGNATAAQYPGDKLASNGIKHVIDRLKGEYDFVVMSTPGVEQIGSTEILCNDCQAVISTITLGRTTKAKLALVKNLAPAAKRYIVVIK